MNEVIDQLKEFIKELEQAEGLTLKQYKAHNDELSRIDALLCHIAELVDEKPRIK